MDTARSRAIVLDQSPRYELVAAVRRESRRGPLRFYTRVAPVGALIVAVSHVALAGPSLTAGVALPLWVLSTVLGVADLLRRRRSR